MNDIIDTLMLSSLKHNYVEFVELYGFEEANKKLHNLFGETWLQHKELVWQWYDTDRPHITVVYKIGGAV